MGTGYKKMPRLFVGTKIGVRNDELTVLTSDLKAGFHCSKTADQTDYFASTWSLTLKSPALNIVAFFLSRRQREYLHGKYSSGKLRIP